LKLALYALHTKGEHHPRVYEAIAAIQTVLTQPAQEPVALVIDGVLVKSALPEKYTGHLYTTPLQREWNAALDEAAARIGEIKGFGQATQDSFAVFIKGLKR